MRIFKSLVSGLLTVPLAGVLLLTACGKTPADAPTSSGTAVSVSSLPEDSGLPGDTLPDESQTGEQTSDARSDDTTGRTAAPTKSTSYGTSTGSTTARTEAPTTTKKETPSMSDKTVELIGRFQQQGDSYRFAWSGSTISAGFEGTGIAIRLAIDSNAQKDYVNVTVDDGEPFVLTLKRGTDYYMLKTGLPAGYHSVRVEKRTEGAQSTLCFSGFDYLDGKAAPAPGRKTRRIELIGDSVTAGYGNIGEDGWTGYKMTEQDAGLTYGAMAAAQLDAEAVIIAVSGQGMYQNLGGQTSPVMRDFYPRILPNDDSAAARWDFQTAIPDVVVINLGTNDYASNVDPQNFVKAYRDFIASLRAKYPDAFVICMVGPHNVGLRSISAVEEVVNTVRQKGDDRVAMCISALEPDEGLYGVDGHPSVKAHRLAAADLVACIRENLHW